MSEVKHSSGPWAWRKFGCDYGLFTDHGGRRVVLCAGMDNAIGDWNPPGNTFLYTDGGIGQAMVIITPDHPNAKLIAAAPELLAACRAALAVIGVSNPVALALREAIAKATASE